MAGEDILEYELRRVEASRAVTSAIYPDSRDPYEKHDAPSEYHDYPDYADYLDYSDYLDG